ncbi:MAG: S8 family serine peptidase [Firmicutes bacterium]|nr:S8 family serine peptidase [Bacillota bacterium]
MRFVRRFLTWVAAAAVWVAWPALAAAQGWSAPGSVWTVSAGQAISAAVPNAPPGTPASWFLVAADTGVMYPLLSETTTPAILQIPQALPGGHYMLEADVGAGSLRSVWTGPALVVMPDPAVRGQITGQGMFDPFFVYRHYNMLPVFQEGDFGQGQTIVLYEASAVLWSDVAQFDALFGLPPVSAATVAPDGPTGIVSGAQLEATMDVEWVHAMAPQAHLVLYEAPYTGDAYNHAVRYAAAIGATAFSLSYYDPNGFRAEGYLTAPVDNLEIEHAAMAGVGLFAAAGDFGLAGTQDRLDWPAANEYTVAVGGTMINPLGQDVWWQGVPYPWDAGGYGFSDYPMARWQAEEWTRLGLLGSPLDALVPGLVHRYLPDVSFLAWNAPIIVNGVLQANGGTSLAAPCWAGIWALAQAHYAQTYGADLRGAIVPEVLYRVANATGPTPEVLPAFLDQAFGQPAPFTAQLGFGPPNVANLVYDVAAVYAPAPSGSAGGGFMVLS